MLIVTSDTLPGYNICAVFGGVLGVAACTRNKYEAGMRDLYGREIDRLRTLRQTRVDAIDAMVGDAANMGANAVVAMRFDHRDVTDAWVEVCAYGTAVLAHPADGPCPRSSADRAPLS